MRKEELFDLIGELDTDLLYDAHAKPQLKLTTIRRAVAVSAAAAVVIISFVIYALFVAPASFICLDADEFVSVTLNQRENILAVTAKSPRFETVVGSNAETAIEEIVSSMIVEGVLNEDENTLLIASDRMHEKIARSVIDICQKYHFDGSVIGIDLPDTDSHNKDISLAKVALMDMIASESATLSFDSLKELSVNELNLLLHQTEISRENIFIEGKPSERMFIGADHAEEIARGQSKLSKSEDISVCYSVYQHKLIYLVELRSSDSAEAYFISADNGDLRVSLRSNIDKLSQAIHREISASNITASQDDRDTSSGSEQNGSGYSPTEPAESAETFTSDIREDPTLREDSSDSVSASERSEETRASENTKTQSSETMPSRPDDGSSEYRSIPVSMLELSFITMTPPPSANSISYQTIFEGQYFENRTGEKKNEGKLCIITSPAQLRAFLSENNYAYLDREGETFRNTFSDYYFSAHSLIVSSCVFTDTSYYTSVTDLKSEEGSLFIEDTLAYGDVRNGVYYCRTLSVYEVAKEDISDEVEIVVY